MSNETTAMEWQPIETSPKDRPVILTDGAGIVSLGIWENEWHFVDDTDLFWNGNDICVALNSWLFGYGPTHWMPLPEPPSTSE